MTCTFFGHWLSPAEIKPEIKKAVIDLIENHGVDMFYVGTHGGFDRMAKEVLEDLSGVYNIDYRLVLSRVPGKKSETDFTDYSHSIVPDGMEKTPPKFGIVYRNKWMIKMSDYVITYITDRFGDGAAQFAALAEKRGKAVIKLGDN